MNNPFEIIQTELFEIKSELQKLHEKSKTDYSNKFYTYKEAADLVGCSDQTIRNHVKKGELKATKFGPKLKRIHHNQLFDSNNEVKSFKYKR